MFQYPGHDGAATADWPDKWWRVSPDQSPGPGRIDSGSTGEVSVDLTITKITHPPPVYFSSGANLHRGLHRSMSGLKLYSLGLPNTFFLGATE